MPLMIFTNCNPLDPWWETPKNCLKIASMLPVWWSVPDPGWCWNVWDDRMAQACPAMVIMLESRRSSINSSFMNSHRHCISASYVSTSRYNWGGAAIATQPNGTNKTWDEKCWNYFLDFVAMKYKIRWFPYFLFDFIQLFNIKMKKPWQIATSNIRKAYIY